MHQVASLDLFRKFQQCSWTVRLIALGLLAICVLYVGFALTPSSYGMALGMLGLDPQGLLLGTPRSIRSDEWMVLTPYYQITVANGFRAIDGISPYHESLRAFQALPLMDWGMFFKPYHWGFLILPPANAYSLFYLFMSMAFVVGWAVFFHALRLARLPAMLLSMCLWLSPFVQVWWTSNAGAFALAPWAVIGWLFIEERLLRIVVCTYALVAWLISCVYPPFIYCAALAMVVAVLAFRRDRVRPALVLDAVLASGVAFTVFFFYFHDLIEVMRHTVYPGQRISTAGGEHWAKLLGHLTPGLTTRGYEPFTGFASNACEIAIMSSWLPAYALTLTDYRQLWERVRKDWIGVLTLLAGVLLIVGWSFLPLPGFVGKYTGLFMVPPGRALMALGLLLNLGAAFIVVRAGVTFGQYRLLALGALIVSGTLVKLRFGENCLKDVYSASDLIPYVGFALVVALSCVRRSPSFQGVLLLAISMLLNALGYGLFNPVQSAVPIFSIDQASVHRNLMDRGAQQAADGTLVVPGHYGALLVGAGFPAINHVLMHPELSFFRKRFPDLPADYFNTLFNRYAHIVVGGRMPELLYPDQVQVPALPFISGTDSSQGSSVHGDKQ